MNKELLTKLNALPKSWNEVSLNDYNKLVEAGIVSDEYDEETSSIDIPLAIISALTNTPLDDLESISYIRIAPFIQNLNWFFVAPEDAKTAYKCKPISEITYAEFTQWMQLKNEPYKYVNELLPIFYPDLKDVDINTLSVPEINSMFFFVVKSLKKHLKYLALSSRWQQVKMKMSRLFTKT
jgi:hypothetical protein